MIKNLGGEREPNWGRKDERNKETKQLCTTLLLLSFNLILYLVCLKYNNATLFIGCYPIAITSNLTSWLTNWHLFFIYNTPSPKKDLALKGLAFQTGGGDCWKLNTRTHVASALGKLANASKLLWWYDPSSFACVCWEIFRKYSTRYGSAINGRMPLFNRGFL